MRIAFHGMGGSHWPVGLSFYWNLFHALRLTYGDQVAFLLLAAASDQTAEEYVHAVSADRIIRYDPLVRGTLRWAVNRFLHRITWRDVTVEKSLRETQVDVLIAQQVVSKYPHVATLAWFPDFQHRHLPENFSEEERNLRDRAYARWSQLATRVLLMSEAVKRDLEIFMPQFVHKAHVLPSVSYIPAAIYNADLDSILEKYDLPSKFVYLPNQFWKHKNHECVFRALKLLKDRGTVVTLVCTGSSEDYRHPTYFADLMVKLELWNIREQVNYLGLVPRDHVFALVRQSVCVLNPSLYEGWGYTVEEARSIGKKSLLSDIPTHREQNPPGAIFFDPQDVEDLAAKLESIWRNTMPGPDLQMEIAARRGLDGRLRAYAEAFMQIAQEAVRQVRR